MKGDNLLALPVIEQCKIPAVNPGDWLSRLIRHNDIEVDQALWLDLRMRGERSYRRCRRGTGAGGIWPRLNSSLLRENRRQNTKDKSQTKAVRCTHTLH